jgi:hypothetical protein
MTWSLWTSLSYAEKMPLIKGKLQTEDHNKSEKAAALIIEQQEKAIKTHRAMDRRRTDRLIDQQQSCSARMRRGGLRRIFQAAGAQR